MRKSIYFIWVLFLPMFMQAQQVDVMKLYNQAQVAVEMGYLDDAINKYKQILEINPKFAKGYLELGNVYLKKGQDVNSIENAINYFTQYLRVNPNAEDKESVKTTLDKLEFVLEKTYQKEDAREFLQGRWASDDGKIDEYRRSLFILDMEEFDNKMKISIEPSSLLYSNDFTHKTVYVDNPNAEQYVFTFTDDDTYVPSQAGYAFKSQMISQASNNAFGGSSWGQLVEAMGQYSNNKKQENDLSRKTLTVYELKLNSVPNEHNELVCKGRLFVEETTPIKKQILLDSIFTINFYKVPNNFVNSKPISFRSGLAMMEDSKNKKNAKTGGQQSLLGAVFNNSEQVENFYAATKQAEKLLRNYPDPKISGMYKNGVIKDEMGTYIMAFGVSGLICGIFLFADVIPEGDKYATPVTAIGASLMAVGIPLMISGSKQKKEAVKLYNESEKAKSNISELRLGISGNGIGLTFNF